MDHSSASTLRRGGRPGIGRCANVASPRPPKSCWRPSYERGPDLRVVLLIVLIAWLRGPTVIAVLPAALPPGSAHHRHGWFAGGLGVSHMRCSGRNLDLVACFGRQPSQPGGEPLPCSPLALARPAGPEGGVWRCGGARRAAQGPGPGDRWHGLEATGARCV